MKKFIIIILALFLLAGCAKGKQVTSTGKIDGGKEVPQQVQGVPGLQGPADRLELHFLDVGQGDSVLVQFPNGQNMLIDSGPNDSAFLLINYLKKNGIKRIDYLIGTHPHEDHIGSLDSVIKNFEVGEVLLPGVTANTRAFRDLLTAIDRKGLQIIKAKGGLNILEADNLSAKILAPLGSLYEDLNNNSVVIKVKYGEVAFLLTGDMEEPAEKDLLAGNADVKADILKVGHHGSNSSTSRAFLSVVAPRYAVISVGAENDYHHPHQVTLDRLKKAGASVLRTDEKGNIVFTTNGQEIGITTSK